MENTLILSDRANKQIIMLSSILNQAHGRPAAHDIPAAVAESWTTNDSGAHRDYSSEWSARHL